MKRARRLQPVTFVGIFISETEGSFQVTSAKDSHSQHTNIHMNFLSHILPSAFLLVLMPPKHTAEAPKYPSSCRPLQQPAWRRDQPAGFRALNYPLDVIKL